MSWKERIPWLRDGNKSKRLIYPDLTKPTYSIRDTTDGQPLIHFIDHPELVVSNKLYGEGITLCTDMISWMDSLDSPSKTEPTEEIAQNYWYKLSTLFEKVKVEDHLCIGLFSADQADTLIDISRNGDKVELGSVIILSEVPVPHQVQNQLLIMEGISLKISRLVLDEDLLLLHPIFENVIEFGYNQTFDHSFKCTQRSVIHTRDGARHDRYDEGQSLYFHPMGSYVLSGHLLGHF